MENLFYSHISFTNAFPLNFDKGILILILEIGFIRKTKEKASSITVYKLSQNNFKDDSEFRFSGRRVYHIYLVIMYQVRGS